MRISDWSSDVCSSDLVGGKVIADAEPDPADTSIHQMRTGVFFNTSGTTSGADVSGNTFDYITQDAIRFHREILECNVSHNRSEDSRVGKECGSKCRSWWSPYR